MSASMSSSVGGDRPVSAVVLRDAEVAGAPRVVGRASTVAKPAAPTSAPAVAASAAAPAAAPVVDEDLLRQVRAEAFERGKEAAAEAQRRTGYEDGLRQGLAEGRVTGEQEAQRRLASAQELAAERIRRLDELASAWPTELREQLARRLLAAEDDMIELCHDVVCRLLGDALVTRTGAAHAVRAGIEQWLLAGEKQAREESLVVQVHPLDLDAMKADEMLARWLVQQGVKGLQWQAGDGVELGGCIVSGADGDLDARLETQLATLRALLLHGRAAPTRAPAALAAPRRADFGGDPQ